MGSWDRTWGLDVVLDVPWGGCPRYDKVEVG